MKLCYIDCDGWDFGIVYFSDNPDQWGDDWGDAPYEHNAGCPYIEDGFNVVSYFINGHFKVPCAGYDNSPYSVEEINELKRVPWLRTLENSLYAGATIEEFLKFCKENNIDVYEKMEL